MLVQAYLSKIRSLKFNLAKPDNPDLRRDVLAGSIDPQRLVNMTAEEMAPEKARAECCCVLSSCSHVHHSLRRNERQSGTK